jgi:hypothetical protein
VITVSLFGGLGNQMFQYAAGKALAERHGVPLALDVSGFRHNSQRPFMLDRLSVPEAHAEPNAQGSANRFGSTNYFVRGLWRQRADRLFDRARLPKPAVVFGQYCEPHFHYDPGFELLGSKTALFGDFQSERYFHSIAEVLRDLFSLREPFGDEAAETYSRIATSGTSVSVHIRRGDYLNPGTAETHGILGDGYYREAIDRIEIALDKKPDFFVFSDDLAAAEQVLSFLPGSHLHFVRGDPMRPWEDMALMAGCQHHVIANSSFSWWGAWLNRSPEKVVVAPRGWFAPTAYRKRNTSDLCPTSWVLI